nr:hypothetical transcript [Hymenolepis microstoma]
MGSKYRLSALSQMKFRISYLFLLLLTPGIYAQSNAKSVLFTDPRFDAERCTLLFNNILNLPNFTELKSQQISPLFLHALSTPPTSRELASQYKIIQNTSILVEIGPDYLYGPNYFAKQTATNVDSVMRSRITAFDLTKGMQNRVLEAAIMHLVRNSDIVNFTYVYDDTETLIHPFSKMVNFGFMNDMIKKVTVHPLSSFDTPEDVLGQILVEGSNIIVLNVPQNAALEILKRAEVKNILQQPFYWIVFDAGITLSGQQFNVEDTNFYAIEFSTNGDLKRFPELSSFTRPITPQDLVFRDTAVKALVEIQSQLKQTVSIPTYITSSFDQNDKQTWIFYSYMYTSQDIQSAYKVTIDESRKIEAGLQAPKPPPSRESLLQLLKRKGLRLGTVLIPPLITEETTGNSSRKLRGAEIALAEELMRRLNVSYEITTYELGIGFEDGGKWTGVFENLQKWDMDLLVAPFTNTEERSASFRCTTPYQSFSYKFILLPHSLKASLEIFQFTLAFDVYTWIMIFVAAVAIAGSLALLHKISPNSLSFGIHPSMIFVFGYLFQGVRTRSPSALSSQIVIVVWWFFCLVLVIAFCANYAAFRSFNALETLPNSPNTLLHQEYYKYSYIKGSTLEFLMSITQDPSIHEIYVMINTKFDNVSPDTREEGLDQVLRGGFALLDESPMIDYYARKHCLTISEPLWYDTYVFYTPKLMPFFDIINEELIRMKEDGTVDAILEENHAKLFASLPNTCEVTFKEQAVRAMRNPLVNWSPYSIEFIAAFGIFIICLGSLLVVLLVLIVECCLKVYEKVDQGHHE